MIYLMPAWELASRNKLVNDLILVAQNRKNPVQVFLETVLNDHAKRFVYASLNYYYR